MPRKSSDEANQLWSYIPPVGYYDSIVHIHHCHLFIIYTSVQTIQVVILWLFLLS